METAAEQRLQQLDAYVRVEIEGGVRESTALVTALEGTVEELRQAVSVDRLALVVREQELGAMRALLETESLRATVSEQVGSIVYVCVYMRTLYTD